MIKFIMDVLIWTFRALLFISIITKLGVETSACVAVIGAVGLAIGRSRQGSLSNFAGGLLIILFKPLRAGDYIEAQGETVPLLLSLFSVPKLLRLITSLYICQTALFQTVK